MAKDPKIQNKIRSITKDLPCELTSEELMDRSKDLAEAVKAVANAENQKKLAVSSHTSEIKRAEAKRDVLSNVVSTGQEYKEVLVERVWDYKNKKIIETRTDTGEVILTRDMSDDEMQLELGLEEGEDS